MCKAGGCGGCGEGELKPLVGCFIILPHFGAAYARAGALLSFFFSVFLQDVNVNHVVNTN